MSAQAEHDRFVARIRERYPDIGEEVLRVLALTYDQRYYAMTELDAVKQAMIESVGWDAAIGILARSRELMPHSPTGACAP